MNSITNSAQHNALWQVCCTHNCARTVCAVTRPRRSVTACLNCPSPSPVATQGQTIYVAIENSLSRQRSHGKSVATGFYLVMPSSARSHAGSESPARTHACRACLSNALSHVLVCAYRMHCRTRWCTPVVPPYRNMNTVSRHKASQP